MVGIIWVILIVLIILIMIMMVWEGLGCCVGHTAWAPEGREWHYEAGPKGRSLEVGARRAPRLLVLYIRPDLLPVRTVLHFLQCYSLTASLTIIDKGISNLKALAGSAEEAVSAEGRKCPPCILRTHRHKVKHGHWTLHTYAGWPGVSIISTISR